MMEVAYEANDPKPLKGLNYYRLKQVDKDAKFVFSRIAKVDMGKKYTIVISPNPAKGSITIDGIENFRYIHLIDVNGKLVKQWQRSNDGRYDIQDIKPGVYLLRLINWDEMQTHKLIIE